MLANGQSAGKAYTYNMDNESDIIEKKRSDLLKVVRELDSKGFMCGSSGNISIKIDDNRYLITPSGIPVFILEEDNILLIDSGGNTIDNRNDGLKASSEVLMHLLCYKKKADIRSVIHSHAPSASAFAISGKSLDLCVMPEIIMVLGQIPLVPYMTPATGDLAGLVSDYIQKDHRAVLLENHGVLVTGKDVFDACNNLTLVETYAKTYINALSLGNVNTLSENQVGRLNELKKGLSFETTSITCNSESSSEPGAKTRETEDRNIKELAKMITDVIHKEILKI
jgi:L-fuculose-phosphate aldolase